jgi:hypothetical protein
MRFEAPHPRTPASLRSKRRSSVASLTVRSGLRDDLAFCGVYREAGDGKLIAQRIVRPSLTRTPIIGETVRRPKTLATAAAVKCLREEVERLVAAGLWTGSGINQTAIADGRYSSCGLRAYSQS